MPPYHTKLESPAKHHWGGADKEASEPCEARREPSEASISLKGSCIRPGTRSDIGAHCMSAMEPRVVVGCGCKVRSKERRRNCKPSQSPWRLTAYGDTRRRGDASFVQRKARPSPILL